MLYIFFTKHLQTAGSPPHHAPPGQITGCLNTVDRAMYANVQKRDDIEVQELRTAGGAWLKSLREQAGLSQRELADKVGVTYYSFVSQLENGRGRLPPDRYEAWAKALGMDPRDFTRGLMRFYDPVTYRIKDRMVTAPSRIAIHVGLQRLCVGATGGAADAKAHGQIGDLLIDGLDVGDLLAGFGVQIGKVIDPAVDGHRLRFSHMSRSPVQGQKKPARWSGPAGRVCPGDA